MLNPIIADCNVTSNIINAFTAIGTIGAVIVGIFGNRIRAWFIKPKLEIDFRLDTPDKTEVAKDSSSDQKYHKREYCIKVSNNGKTIAKGCQLIIGELYKRRGDGKYVLEKNFFSAPLQWFGNTSASLDIGKKMSSYVNWLSIDDAKDANGDNNSSGTNSTPNSISVLLRFANNNNSYSLHPGTYAFEIKTCADNIDPISNRIEVFWDPSCTWGDLDDPQKFEIKTIDEK